MPQGGVRCLSTDCFQAQLRSANIYTSANDPMASAATHASPKAKIPIALRAYL